MKRFSVCLAVASVALVVAWSGIGPARGEETATSEEKKEVPAVLDFEMKTLAGKPARLDQYQGKVVLIVNTASKCGLTPQYEGLQELHRKFADQGLAVVGFPSNDFGRQEPGSDREISEFCQANYGVEFDMFSKVVVKGDEKCPLYDFLTSEKTNPEFAGEINWNFEKFLVSREGKVVARFEPRTEPTSDEVVQAIEAELEKEPVQ